MVLWYTYFANNKRKNEVSQHLQDLTLNVNSAAKNSLIHSPFPLVILESDGNIIWRSTKFVSEFAEIEIDNYIRDLLEKIDKNTEYQDGEQKSDIEDLILLINDVQELLEYYLYEIYDYTNY